MVRNVFDHPVCASKVASQLFLIAPPPLLYEEATSSCFYDFIPCATLALVPERSRDRDDFVKWTRGATSFQRATKASLNGIVLAALAPIGIGAL